MLENKKFIMSDIIEILRESISLLEISYNGIKSFPLIEYVMQTTFLKMTGYSEQKLKCICWDIASIDYDFRYNYFYKLKFGEYSSKEDKNKIYSELVTLSQIQDVGNTLKQYSEQSRQKVIDVIKESIIIKCLPSESLFFIKEKLVQNKISEKKIIFDDNKVFDNLYKHRNRCAHNLKSYQAELPKINELFNNANEKSPNNYFFFFAELIRLDMIFTYLYSKAVEKIQETNW